MYYETLVEFKQEHPDFIGSKLIYAPRKSSKVDVVERNFKTAIKLHQAFPDFVAGFDLVGQEDIAPPIIDFAERTIALPKNISLFFHAGETNWYGTVDVNLVSRVLCIDSANAK